MPLETYLRKRYFKETPALPGRSRRCTVLVTLSALSPSCSHGSPDVPLCSANLLCLTLLTYSLPNRGLPGGH